MKSSFQKRRKRRISTHTDRSKQSNRRKGHSNTESEIELKKERSTDLVKLNAKGKKLGGGGGFFRPSYLAIGWSHDYNSEPGRSAGKKVLNIGNCTDRIGGKALTEMKMSARSKNKRGIHINRRFWSTRVLRFLWAALFIVMGSCTLLVV